MPRKLIREFQIISFSKTNLRLKDLHVFWIQAQKKKCELNIDTINLVKISLAWLNKNKGKAGIHSFLLVLLLSLKNKEKAL